VCEISVKTTAMNIILLTWTKEHHDTQLRITNMTTDNYITSPYHHRPTRTI